MYRAKLWTNSLQYKKTTNWDMQIKYLWYKREYIQCSSEKVIWQSYCFSLVPNKSFWKVLPAVQTSGRYISLLLSVGILEIRVLLGKTRRRAKMVNKIQLTDGHDGRWQLLENYTSLSLVPAHNLNRWISSSNLERQDILSTISCNNMKAEFKAVWNCDSY